jgi:hypothetical protein
MKVRDNDVRDPLVKTMVGFTHIGDPRYTGTVVYPGGDSNSPRTLVTQEGSGTLHYLKNEETGGVILADPCQIYGVLKDPKDII